MRRIAVITIIALLLPGLSYAQPKPKSLTLTLRDAVWLALRYNPVVQSAEIQRVVDKYALDVANWQFEWHFALQGNANYTDTSVAGQHSYNQSYSLNPSATLFTPIGTQITATSTNTTSNKGKYYNPALSLNVIQPLIRGYDPNVNLAGLRNAYDAEVSRKLALKAAVMDTVTAVIAQYLAVIQAQNSLKSQEQALQQALDKLNQERLKVKLGKMAAADLVQPEAGIANQRFQVSQAQNSLEQARLLLLNTIGVDPTTPFTISNDIRLPDEQIPALPRAQDLIMQNDISYQNALLQQRAKERNVIVTRDALRVQLNLTLNGVTGAGTGGRPDGNIESLFNGRNQSSSASLQLVVPIDDRTLEMNYLTAKVTVKQGEIALRQQRWILESTIMNALRNLAALKVQVDLAIQARDLAVRSLQIAEKKLQLGKGTTFETTQLRTNLVSAEIQAINAEIAYITAISNLQRTLGTTLDVWRMNVRY